MHYDARYTPFGGVWGIGSSQPATVEAPHPLSLEALPLPPAYSRHHLSPPCCH